MKLEVRPEEVYLCTLLHYFVHPPTQNSATGEQLNPKVVSHKLAVFLLKQIKGTDQPCYPKLRTLCGQLVSELGDVGMELVRQLEVVLQGLTSPDDLVKLFEALGMLLVKSGTAPSVQGDSAIAGVDPQSPFGLFLRKCRVSFLSMGFEAVARLATEMQVAMTEAAAAATEAAGGSNASAPATRPALRDRSVVEAFLTQVLRKVEQQGGSVSSADVAALLSDLPAEGPLQCRVLLVHLTVALQRRDYSAALDSLHRYFDHLQAGGSAAGGPAGLGGSSLPDTGPARGRYQWALLSLSSAHVAFGHTQEALSALNETLRMAQQNNDHWCLAHALATLCRLLSSCAPGAPGLPAEGLASIKHGPHHMQLLALLRRCQQRSNELQCPHLTAFAKLSLAKFALQHAVEPGGQAAGTKNLGGSTSGNGATGGGPARAPGGDGSAVGQPAPLQVRRALHDISMLHHLAALEASAGGIAAPRTNLTQTGIAAANRATLNELFTSSGVFGPMSGGRAGCVASAHAVKQLEGSAHLLQSAAWRLHGSSTLCHLHALVCLSCHANCAPAEDVALAYAHLINAIKDKQGVQAAESASALAESRFPLAAPKPLRCAQLAAAHDRSLAHHSALAAELAVSELLNLADPAPYVDMELRAEAQRRVVMNLAAAGDTSRAATLANDLFCKCAQAGMQVEAVSALLLLAEVHLAGENPTAAFPYALTCGLHAAAQHHHLLAAEAVLLLASIWLQLSPGHRPQVVRMMQDVMPLVLGHGSVRLQAKAQLDLAGVILAGADQRDVEKQYPQLVAWLTAAGTGYERCEDLNHAAEAWYLLAQLHHSCGHTRERDQAAEHFHAASQRQEQAH